MYTNFKILCHKNGKLERTLLMASRLQHAYRSMRIRQARLQGYEGDACTECGNFTLVRNGTCLKCDTCGGTSGCS